MLDALLQRYSCWQNERIVATMELGVKPHLNSHLHSRITLGFNITEKNPHKRQGTILHMARVAQGKSRDELGAAVGVSREAVRLWELGKRSIDAVMLPRLAEVLKQDVNVFWS
jgi:DNA-binding XRE family transcriptional regulator